MDKEYLLAHLLAQSEAGSEFRSWPAHITLVPWFNVEDLPTFMNSLEIMTSGVQPIHTVTGSLEELGESRREEVRKILRTTELQVFHLALLGITQSRAALKDKSRHFGEAYNPHITKHSGMEAGQLITLNSFSLVEAEERQQRGNRLKTVLKTYVLLDESHETTA
jgi:hypothetical protein